jgi:hypothetical protein
MLSRDGMGIVIPWAGVLLLVVDYVTVMYLFACDSRYVCEVQAV